MKTYLNLVRNILDHGIEKSNRTGVSAISLFGTQSRYDLRDGFPLLTTKKILFDSVVRELLWFLRGSTNINDDLTQHTPIWDAWADEKGDLGPVYGKQWRNWTVYVRDPIHGLKYISIDQLENAIHQIKIQPDSRRIIVNSWNVGELERMALPPCHILMQFNVTSSKLDLQVYQRSADVGLGVPFNIASYALLLTMIAQECELIPGVLVHTLGDAHIYVNHVEGLHRQLRRDTFPLPRVEIEKKPVFDIKFEDIRLVDYQHHPFIRLPIAV